MDVSEDSDVKLQRARSTLIADFQRDLPIFLYPPDLESDVQEPRRLVRVSTTAELTQMLEPFQEWPQLLDPHLSGIIGPLSGAFLQCMGRTERIPDAQKEWVKPLQWAISKLLYTLCKIRGPKTITRLLQNEARYLEPMLMAYHPSPDEPTDAQLSWEEKYIFLLWISHLLFTPFDLSTVGDVDPNSSLSDTSGIELPDEVPSIAQCLVSIATSQMTTSGKEREAAVKVLTRLCLRADMLKLGLHQILLRWSLDDLQSWAKVAENASPYVAIGHLSFLAGMIMSADARIMFPFLLSIFKNIKALIELKNSLSGEPVLSAVARKAVIKIYRAITLCALQVEALPERSYTYSVSEYVLEEVIDHLLTSMADKDTPVRYAASKALSMITIKLDPQLAAEITEAVTGSLGENVLWESLRNVEIQPAFGSSAYTKPKMRNLSAVNPLRWHGLTLSLAQLLFQRSPPPSQLPPILNSLILTLNFEQRGSSGTSIGTNVRDAANFGVWSLARRYSTVELKNVDANAIENASELASRKVYSGPKSVLQILAVELIQAACLDPSGNIRRGSSAALQELIGRHPNTIASGIKVVQIVDYHAVALRQRAIESVAIEAAKCSPVYWDGLLDQLLGWRGVGSSDAPSRRYAARAIGDLSVLQGFDGWQIVASSLWTNLNRLGRQDIERRHGLMLATSASIKAFWHLELAPEQLQTALAMMSHFVKYGIDSPQRDKDLHMATLRPNLTAEAICSFISSIAATVNRGLLENLPDSIQSRSWQLIDLCISRRDSTVANAVVNAIVNMLSMSDKTTQTNLLMKWLRQVAADTSQTGAMGQSPFKESMLEICGHVYSFYTQETPTFTKEEEHIWTLLGHTVTRIGEEPIENRVAALKGINRSLRHCHAMPVVGFDAILEALEDYTTDQRGDIGSTARLAGLDAAETALRHKRVGEIEKRRKLIASVARLAVEKLDKIRLKAYRCLQTFWSAEAAAGFPSFEGIERGSFPMALSDDISDVGRVLTPAYYTQMLDLTAVDWLGKSILTGYLTSAGGGSESVLQASRKALAAHLNASNAKRMKLADDFQMVIGDTYKNPRLVVPMLETLAYLMQTNLLNQLKQDQFDWRSIYTTTQAAHSGKSTIEQHAAAVDVYFGLAAVPSLRKVALKKLASMTLHPHAKIRNAAAERLYVRSNIASMEDVDWSSPVKELKPHVEKIRSALA